jgi:hypothetical protein
MANKKSLKEKLTKWQSHREVHAQPSDKMLYEFLEELIESLKDDEPKQPEEETPPPPIANTEEGDNEDEDSSNPPGGGPGTPP